MTSLRRSALGILLALLGLQLAVSGPLASQATGSDTRLAGHSTAATLPAPPVSPGLELEDGKADAGPMRSSTGIDDRPVPSSRPTHHAVPTAWRADDALARAGRLSAPSTAPPLSGA